MCSLHGDRETSWRICRAWYDNQIAQARDDLEALWKEPRLLLVKQVGCGYKGEKRDGEKVPGQCALGSHFRLTHRKKCLFPRKLEGERFMWPDEVECQRSEESGSSCMSVFP